jgi:glutamate racemase
VLATQATLASERVQALLDKHAGEVEVLRRPGVGWVEQVEAGELDSALTRARWLLCVPLLLENIDHIALGCTHYPFLSPLIRELTGEQIALYDPAEAIARRVDSLLQQHGSDSIGDHCYRFITTAPDTAHGQHAAIADRSRPCCRIPESGVNHAATSHHASTAAHHPARSPPPGPCPVQRCSRNGQPANR